MVKIDLDAGAMDILNGIILREHYETPSDAIRHLDNKNALQGAVIHNQDNEITKLEDEIARLRGIMKTAGIV